MPSNATSATPPERFALVLRAVPDPGGVPAIIRLRRFLKMSLRSYGLRCVSIRPALESDARGETKTGRR